MNSDKLPGQVTRTQRIVKGIALTEVQARDGNVQRHPIVMVHGGCHGSWQWANLQTWFAERGWSSTAIDWLSHGWSEQLPREQWLHREIPAVSHEIEIACAEASAAANRSPIVIGHSMGGLATLAYAATTSRELAAVVLLTPVVPRQYGAAAIELDVDLDQPWSPPSPDVARQLFYSGVDDAIASECYQRLQPESPAAVWQATRWTAEVDVSAVRAPALVVAAEQDLLVPADYVLALASGLGAERILLRGAGHGVTLDPGWPDLASRIEEWLDTVASPRV
jgi:pimeloyl-ACP methyl ester carboxylesterase